MSAIRFAVSVFFSFIFLTLFSSASIAQQFDKQSFDIYEDSSGHIYFVPKDRFLLIASEPIVPLNLTYPNGFKLVYSGGDYTRIEMLPEGFQPSGDLRYSPNGANEFNIELADFNADGLLDWFIQKDGKGSDVLIVFNNATSIPTTFWKYTSIQGVNVAKSNATIVIEDVDGDGIVDLKIGEDTYAYTDPDSGYNRLALPPETRHVNVAKPNNGTVVAGATQGSFRVDENGAATYTIPLAVPKGPGGIFPELALKYSSLGGDGPLGLGWQLAGLSSISRCQPSMVQDGYMGETRFFREKAGEYSERTRVPGGRNERYKTTWYDHYYEADYRFCLDGKRLVLTSGSYTSGTAEYRLETANFARVKAFTTSSSLGPNYFTVEKRDGSKWTYGETANSKSQITSPGRANYNWKLSSVEDNLGNTISYTYTEDGNYIDSITYSTNRPVKIQFNYEDRPAARSGYIFGKLNQYNQQLSSISVTNNGQPFRTYYLTYGQANSSDLSQIAWIQECGANATCFEPVKFDWLRDDYNDSYREVITGASSHADLGVRQGDFDGDGITDLAWSTQGSSDVVRFMLSSRRTSPTSSEYARKEQSVRDRDWLVGDLNQDGISDIISFSSSSWYFFKASKGGGFTRYSVKPRHGGGVVMNPQLVDLNGDGLADIYYRTRETVGQGSHREIVTRYKVAFHKKNFSNNSLFENPVNFSITVTEDSESLPIDPESVRFTDVNGDGLSDFLVKVKFSTNRRNVYIYRWYLLEMDRSIGMDFRKAKSTRLSFIPDNSDRFRFTDINGDGFKDVLLTNTSYLNTGNGFVRGPNHSLGRYVTRAKALDYNHDNLTDFLHYTGNSWKLFINNGNGFDIFQANTATRHLPSQESYRDIVIADLTGDGRDDFVVLTNRSRERSIVVHHTGIRDFEGLNKIQPMGRINKITNAGVVTDINYAAMAGYDSEVYERSWDASSWTRSGTAAYFDLIGSVFLVKEVSSSAPSASNRNAKNTIRYFYQGGKAQAGGRGSLGFQYLTTFDPDAKVLTTTEYAQKFPFTGMPIKTTKLKYLGGQVDRSVFIAKEFGNGDTTAASEISSVPQKFNNFSVFDSGRLLGDASCQLADTSYKVIGCSINELASVNANSKSGHSKFRGYVRYPFVHRTYDYNYSPEGQLLALSHIVNQYEGSTNSFYGNVGYQYTGIQQLVGDKKAVSKKTVNHTYSDVINSEKWYLGRLTDTRVTHQSWISGETVPASITKHSTFRYDANGMLDQTIVEPNSPELAVITTNTFDSYGNVVTEEVKSHSSIAANDEKYFLRKSKTEYLAGSDNRHPSKTYVWTGESYRLESTATDYNQFDLPTKVYDANSFVMINTYDNFGRLSKSQNHLGVVSETIRGFCPQDGHCPSLARTFEHSMSNTGAEGKVFYDALGQKLRVSKREFDGTWVHVDSEYDKRGNVVAISNPHTGAYGTARYKTVSVYDEFDRLISTTSPTPAGDATVVQSYDGYTQTITNAKGQQQISVSNALGQLISSTNAMGHTITYSYDVLGNLVKVTDPVGNVSSLTYNKMGHKTQMNDPNKGIWKYRYNALGELVWQNNARDEITEVRYDFGGRILSRVDYGRDVGRKGKKIGRRPTYGYAEWEYDTAANGINQLHSVSDKVTGYKKTLSYQSNGLLKSQTTHIDGKDYLEWFSYDELGRVTHAYDPTEAVLNQENTAGVKTVYNSFGYVSEIREAKNDAVYFKTLETDMFGNVTKAEQGNGVVLSNYYYPQNGQLQRKKAEKGSSTFQNEGLQYDILGNLKTKELVHHGVKESFTYDELNRLITAKTTGFYSDNSGNYPGHNFTMHYMNDGTGNIKRRDGAVAGPEYQYHQNNGGPHALSSLGENSYFYDANGNRIREKKGDTLTRWTHYSVFDKPISITKGENKVRLTYGPDRNRYKRVDETSKGTTTTRYIGGVEHITTDDQDFYKRHIAGQVIVTTGGDHAGQQYLIRDYMGSVVATVSAQGVLEQYHSFDPYGKRRAVVRDENSAFEAISFNVDQYFDPAGKNPTRGFTGHEHMDGVGLIHMNGRVYDAETMVFMSADPFVQAPDSVLSLNRYSYVFNNPINNSDPSGYFSLSKAVKFVGKVYGFAWGVPLIEWAADNPREAAAIAAAAAIGMMVGPTTPLGKIMTGAVGGAVAGAIQTGDLNGALQGAAFGAVRGAIGAAYGGSTVGTSGWGIQVSLHANVSGIRSYVNGGKFGHGFWSSALTAVAVDSIGMDSGELRLIASVVVQGTASQVMGGKFSNGAMSAAFTEIFNHWQSSCSARARHCLFKSLSEEGQQSVRTAAGVWATVVTGPVPIGKTGFFSTIKSWFGVTQITLPSTRMAKILADHSYHGIKSQVGKIPVKALEARLAKNGMFPKDWKQNKIENALNYAYKNAVNSGLKDGHMQVKYKGVDMRVFAKDGDVRSIYPVGNKLTLKDFGL